MPAPQVWCVRPREGGGREAEFPLFPGGTPHTRPGIEAWRCGTHQVELRRCFQAPAHHVPRGLPCGCECGKGNRIAVGRDAGCWEVAIGPDGRPTRKQSSGEDSATTSCPASSGAPSAAPYSQAGVLGLGELVPPGSWGGNGSGPHPWVTALSCLILRTCSAANEKALASVSCGVQWRCPG